MEVFDLFYLMKGTSRSIVRRNPQPHSHVQMVLRELVSDYTLKVNNTENFQMSSKWELETRILNDALAVYCLLNQRTQIAQIVIHTRNTYAIMDQNLAVIVLLQILMRALSKTSLQIYRERNGLPNSGCYKSNRVSMFIIFIPL